MLPRSAERLDRLEGMVNGTCGYCRGVIIGSDHVACGKCSGTGKTSAARLMGQMLGRIERLERLLGETNDDKPEGGAR